METPKNIKPTELPIYVTTCDDFRHLVRNFAVLFNKFVSPERHVTVFGHLPPEEELPSNFSFQALQFNQLPWSDQMIEFANAVQDKHFILMHEDFYMLAPARLDVLGACERYVATHPEVSRIGLQTVHEGYDTHVDPYDKTDIGSQLYQLHDHYDYLCSFEAGIMSRRFLLDYMRPGERTATAEIEISRRARDHSEICLCTEERVFTYKDARIRGEERIKFIDNELWLLTPGGWQNCHIAV